MWPQGVQVKCGSRSGDLTLRTEGGLGRVGDRLGGGYQMEEREVFHPDLLSPLGMGHRARRDLRVWSATDLGMRL